jgi:hypothetical protein
LTLAKVLWYLPFNSLQEFTQLGGAMPSPIDLHFAERLPPSSSPAPRDERLREFPHILLFASLLLCAICTSCGIVGSGPPPVPPLPVTVTVMPNSAQPFQGGSVQFNAEVKNASGPTINWQVNQIAGGNPTVGTIDSSGHYTAPGSVPNPPTVTVTAVLQSDASKSGSSSVTIQALSSVTGQLVVSPALSSVTTSQTLQFNVLTPGISNTAVIWTAAGGTITPDGNFTPPSTPGAYTIEASLPNAKGFATVEVTNFPGTLTWRNDNSRSGVNSQELALAPATISTSTFGKLFSCSIDGYAYAQPLYLPNLLIPGSGMHNVIFVATEKDSVFAFDADANPCVQLWQTSLIPAGSQAIETPNFQITSTDIVPFVGITGTPVIGVTTSALYVVAATQTIVLNPTYSQRIYALDLATGQPEIQPAGIEISAPSGMIPVFSPNLENQRPALLLDGGIVYVAFGSYGGLGDYHGWLFGYESVSLQQTGVLDFTTNTTQGGIWQSGGGPSADSNHNVFVVTGDGPFDVDRGGMSYSDSFLRLGTSSGLSVSDYFTPCDQATLQTTGEDVGASAPVLLPDSAGSSSQPHLLIGGSKSGSLYVVNRDNMGQFVGPCPDSPTRVQTIPGSAGPIMSTPLFWNNAVYVAPGNGNLVSFPMSGGILASSPSTSQSPETLGPQGATPVISSNGTNNAILWLIDSSGALATPNTPAILRAFDPNNLSKELYHSTTTAGLRDTAGPGVKFAVPTVANGKVYVGTQTELDVYGLLH